ncbi:glycosyltransferase, partial [bacterium]|nr:glycosyltransferase [bacterium]
MAFFHFQDTILWKEKKSMLVSVVIPAYNEENYLPATIASIRQSFDALPHKKYEIIVADDASTDRTADLAQELGARVVYSGKRNIGATRNIGANEANGEVLLFFDADSLLNPNTLKAMFYALDEG